MSQMVLPQTPAPGMQNDASAPKSGSSRDKDTGESRYDSVSRAEQNRLDREKSGRNNDPQNARQDNAKPKAQERAGGSKSEAAGKSTNKQGQQSASEMEATTTPLTFAELQALLTPASGAGAGNAIGKSLTATGMLAGGVVGSNGSMTGMPLANALAAVVGDKAAKTDPSSLLSGTRFESTMEWVSQQGANTPSNKLAAEAQTPLRSYATSVDVPVNHAEWGDKLMGKLSWLTAKNLSVAEIHLTPPDMGPMEVKVRLQNDQANITVHAANPVVRDQLELNSHRLRDMLSEQGLSLAQFDVSDQSQNSQGQSEEPGSEDGNGSSSGAGSMLSDAEDDDADMQTGNLDLSWNGVVDTFA